MSFCVVNGEDIEIVGFFDSYKAYQSDRFNGHPLFDMGAIPEKPFDALVLLSSAFADEIYDSITERFPEIEKKIYVPFLTHAVDDNKVEAEINAIEEICSRSPRQPTVVIPVEGFYVNFLKRIAHLKANGVQDDPDDPSDRVSHSFPLQAVESYFDHIVCFGRDQFSFLKVIRGYPARPHPSHAGV